MKMIETSPFIFNSCLNQIENSITLFRQVDKYKKK